MVTFMFWIFSGHIVINKREHLSVYQPMVFERMIMMKSIIKRFASIFMVLVIVCSFSMSAFAADSAVVPSRDSAVSQENGVEPLGLGSVVASNVGTIYGSGIVSVYLPKGNFFAELVAGIGYATDSGIVSVSVLTPDNEVISLGSMSGTGSSTISHELGYAPAGTYQFYFLSSTQGRLEVYARIYD